MASRRDSFSGRPPARLRLWLTLATLLALVLTLAPLPGRVARAAALAVNSADDVVNPFDGLCTLREAIIVANNDLALSQVPGECPAGFGPDTITLEAGVTYALTIPFNQPPGTPEANPSSGDLDITAP